MMLPRSRRLLSCCRINVDTTKLLAAFPAPGATTTPADNKPTVLRLETTSKNIITGVVLQAPPLAPRTLFGII